jgi:hypothetical protein
VPLANDFFFVFWRRFGLENSGFRNGSGTEKLTRPSTAGRWPSGSGRAPLDFETKIKMGFKTGFEMDFKMPKVAAVGNPG